MMIASLAKVLRIEGQLKIDNFIEKWAFVYGSGTQYGTELYTSFASILTNAYVGSYINNQKTIEKVLGRTLVNLLMVYLKWGVNLRND